MIFQSVSFECNCLSVSLSRGFMQLQQNGSRSCLGWSPVVLDRRPNFPHRFNAAFAKLLWPLVPCWVGHGTVLAHILCIQEGWRHFTRTTVSYARSQVCPCLVRLSRVGHQPPMVVLMKHRSLRYCLSYLLVSWSVTCSLIYRWDDLPAIAQCCWIKERKDTTR